MKKIFALLLVVLTSITLTGCDFIQEGNKDVIDDNSILNDCRGYSDYLVINGECVPVKDFVSKEINIYSNETEVNHMNGIEVMTNFTADLSDSTGLAVVSRDVYEASTDPQNMAADTLADDADNIIVKLTEDGFFEEVSFSDDTGLTVEILANPLALEVYGDFTVVIFEVDMGYDYDEKQFTQKLYDSFYAGGVYLIHNDTGKMFATKEVEFTENSWIYTEDHSRTALITVTLNEPVIEMYNEYQYDEKGNMLLDEEGNHLFITIENPLLDENGDPLIFTEGPVLTEIMDTPQFDYVKVFQFDADDNPILDDNGEQVYILEETPVLDSDGNQLVISQEVPLTDEDGNIQYQETFDVEIFINEIKDITVTEYSANVVDNPLSPLAHKFVDRIMSEYYNWDYWRVNDYHIDSYGFTSTADEIFYIDYKQSDFNGSESNRVLMKISYDITTDEVLIEDYLNLTDAKFDQCTILFDPTTKNVICQQYDQNIKVYTEEFGLKTIPESKNLSPVTFPNGELFFHSNEEDYIEDLGYYTTSLYTINADGSMESHYVELGERDNLCYGVCYSNINVNYYDQLGQPINEDGYNWVDLEFSDGEKMISRADMQIQSIDTFDSERPECNDTNGCWYNTFNEVLDENGEVLYSFESSKVIYPGDEVPNYIERYSFDENAVIEYRKDYTSTDKYCENSIGCTNSMQLVDYTFNQWGLWMHQNVIIAEGEQFLSSIELNDENSAVYEYNKVYTSEICEYEICEEYIEVRILDENDEVISTDSNFVSIVQGELIPLRFDYHMTENSTITLEDTVCTTSYGCQSYHNTFDGYNFWVYYQQGEEMYNDITFDFSDKHIVLNEEIEREVCTDVNGCYIDSIEYNVVNDNGDVLYQFANSTHIEFGYTAPFKVTVNIADTTLQYQKEYSNEDAICNEDTCNEQAQFIQTDGSNEEYLGWSNVTYINGEKIMSRVLIPSTSLESVETQNLCTYTDGCSIPTNNYTIVDEFGNEYQNDNPDWYKQMLPVFFEQGDYIPSNDDFHVTYTISNIEYQKTRMSSWEFMHNLQNVSYLDENLFLIENNNNQEENNYILEFNELSNSYKVNFTNISSLNEISKLGDSFIAVNSDETAIVKLEANEELSTEDFYYFNIENLTDGYQINGVNDLILDYDGTIYFSGVDNFIQHISGTILEDGTITIDTELVEREVIRVRPIN